MNSAKNLQQEGLVQGLLAQGPQETDPEVSTEETRANRGADSPQAMYSHLVSQATYTCHVKY